MAAHGIEKILFRKSVRGSAMKYQGKLHTWNDEKGYGFVAPNGGGKTAFVHIKAFKRPPRRPVEGDIIVYEPQPQATGKLTATNIRYAREPGRVTPQQARSVTLPAVLTVNVASVLLLSVSLHKVPDPLLYVYLAASLLAFMMYGYDKSAAKAGRRRTPENHLHLLSLLGGWPGGLLAQKVFRHKSDLSPKNNTMTLMRFPINWRQWRSQN
ncbi:cold shock and DUF1294 domain-containing protein, partial [Alteromonas sp. ASW11-19]